MPTLPEGGPHGPWLRMHGLPQGVDLVSVSTSVNEPRGNYPPSKWLADESWPVPVLADDAKSSAASAVGLDGFPFWVFVDRSGAVQRCVSGEMTSRGLGPVKRTLLGSVSDPVARRCRAALVSRR